MAVSFARGEDKYRLIKAIDANGKEVPLFSCLEKLRYKVNDGKYAYRLILKNGTKLKIQSNRFEGGEKVLDFTRNFPDEDLRNKDLNDPGIKSYFDLINFTFGYLSNSIKQVNRRMNGAMGSVDAGLMERHFLGRMILQFRKWQIAYMTNRFGNSFLGSDGKIHEKNLNIYSHVIISENDTSINHLSDEYSIR